MPIPGAKYRTTTTDSGKKIRLAFVDGQVQEAKNLASGATHTMREFAADRKKKGSKLKSAMMGTSSTTSNKVL